MIQPRKADPRLLACPVGDHTVTINGPIPPHEFESCNDLTSVTLTSTVTGIEASAFESCTNLVSVTIPDSVTSIGKSAFSACSSLTSITIPNSVTQIGDGILSGCDSLTSVVLPASIPAIGNSCFTGCQSLLSVTIPNTVTSIGSLAFADCVSLTSINIPDSVESIGMGAFYDCPSIETINVGSNNKYFSSDGAVLFNFDKSTLIVFCGVSRAYSIPSSVTAITSGAFYYSRVTSVTIPDSVVSIGDSAFLTCLMLEEVVFLGIACPMYDGTGIFSGCPSTMQIRVFKDYVGSDFGEKPVVKEDVLLSSDKTVILRTSGTLMEYTIPDSVKIIGEKAFCYSSRVSSVTIGTGVTTIGDSAFSGCFSLTHMSIPESVTYIGSSAFSGCFSLTEMSIGNTVASIGDAAFAGCLGLSTVSINNIKAIENFRTIFPTYARITSVIIGDSVSEISSSAFDGCSQLVSVVIPNSVTLIRDTAFANCDSLKKITIPASVTSLGANVFSNCQSLTEVVVCGNIASVGDVGFAGCINLRKFTYSGNQAPSHGSDVFENCFMLNVVTVPDSYSGTHFCGKATSKSRTNTKPTSVSSPTETLDDKVVDVLKETEVVQESAVPWGYVASVVLLLVINVVFLTHAIVEDTRQSLEIADNQQPADLEEPYDINCSK